MNKVIISVSMVVLLATRLCAGSDNHSLIGKRVIATVNDSGIKVESGYVLDVDDTLRLGTRGTVRIERLETVDNKTIDFSFVGARYNPDSKTVSGISSAGESLVISISEVQSVNLSYFSTGRWLPMTFDREAVERRLKGNVRYPQLLQQIPIDSVQSVKVWRKTNSSGILASAFFGAGVGFFVASATAEGPDPDAWLDFTPSRETQIALTTIGGLVMGGAIGYAIFKGHWTTVPLDRVKVNMSASASGGIGLGCSVGL